MSHLLPLFCRLAWAASVPLEGGVLLNEVDADQAGTDAAEFVELAGPPGAPLAGLVLAFYNGSSAGDACTSALVLGPQLVGADGLFVLGSPAVPGVDSVVFGSNDVENGPDALALYDAPGLAAAAFVGTLPGAPPAGARLRDALVYTTGDGTDAALLAALLPGGPTVDEDVHGLAESESMQRIEGGGGAWTVAPPTPGAPNGAATVVAIHAIQGAAHVSPLAGQPVAGVRGVVTALLPDGFTLQSRQEDEDGDEATSEGLFVEGVPAGLAVGDEVLVAGSVDEVRASSNALPVTRLVGAAVVVLASGRALPETIVLGAAGRVPPDTIIDDDTQGGSVTEGVSAFDPGQDGLDFFESLEGMRVVVPRPRAVSHTSTQGEIVVVGDDGQHASGLNPRGALVVSAADFHPERIVLDDVLLAEAGAKMPAVDLGARFEADPGGILAYDFGSYRVLLDAQPVIGPGRLVPEVAAAAPEGALSVATLNVLNLAPQSPAAQFEGLARAIVEHLHSPDLLGLQEIQDDSGPKNDGVVGAAATWDELVAAIAAADGPAYEWTDIPPVDGEDGGQPGGNIRVGFLWRPEHIEMVSRPGGTSTQGTSVVSGKEGPQLSFSPGRIQPELPAFEHSRKPLAAEFRADGRTLFAVVNHFASKSGDSPLFGDLQPPVLSSEAQRVQQAQAVHDFCGEILALDAEALVVVLGDLNDFQFSAPLAELTQGELLHDLVLLLPEGERYSYVFQGNAQVLDHVLVSRALWRASPTYDAVHVHAEFVAGASDHDPGLARLLLPAR